MVYVKHFIRKEKIKILKQTAFCGRLNRDYAAFDIMRTMHHDIFL